MGQWLKAIGGYSVEQIGGKNIRFDPTIVVANKIV